MRTGHFAVPFAALSLILTSCDGRPRDPEDARTAGAERSGPSTVVVVTVEAMRPDLLSTYGGQIGMPALDRAASLGVVFDDATTPCPMARPALASLMTGLGPDRSGVRDNVSDRLPTSVKPVAARFRDAGWTTAAFVTTPFASYASGLDRGFVLFDGPEELVVGPAQHLPPARPAADAAKHFAEWLSGLPPGERAFAWVHLADLHGIATEGTVEEAVKSYREQLPKVDAALGVILESLATTGRAGSSEVVVAGTHGVLLGEGKARGDSFWLTKETLRVPLVWMGGRAAGLRTSGARVSIPAWLPDVGASLAALSAEPLDPMGDARDLFRVPRGATDRRVRQAWTWAPDDQLAWPTLTAVEDGGAWRVFDGLVIGRLRAASARTSVEQTAVDRPAAPQGLALSANARGKLKTAGLSLGKEGAKPPGSPADANAFLEELQSLRQHIARNRSLRARRVSLKLMDEYPDSFAVLLHRLSIVSLGGAKDLAAAVAGRMLELYPDRPEGLHWAAHADLINGRTDRAEALLEAALTLVPQDADMLYDLACARSLAGDRDRAMERLGAAVEAGFRNWDWMERDPDLTNVRSDARFAEMLKAHGR